MIKPISLNERINEIIEINEIKSEYRNATDVRAEEIIILINVIVNDRKMSEKTI